jgi:hypothetical protein
MMQKANVGHGKAKMEKERATLRSSLKVIVQSASRSRCDASRWKKNKSDEEAKKKQRSFIGRRMFLVHLVSNADTCQRYFKRRLGDCSCAATDSLQ